MAEEKRNRRDQSQRGTEGQDRPRRDRKPGDLESGSGRARQEDEEESQE